MTEAPAGPRRDHGADTSKHRLSWLGVAALAAPATPMFALMMPIAIFVPPFYAEHMGLGLAVVGTLFALGRLFDVVTDPLGGLLMDRTERYVGRHAWVTIGALPVGLGTWQIFFAEPPGQASTLLAWLVVLYLGWTLMSVGLFSWGAQVTRDYDERSRVMGAIQLANNAGTVLVLLLPAFIELGADADSVDRARIRAMGAFILVLLPAALLFSWLYAPRADAHPRPAAPFLPALRQAMANRLLRRLLAADLAVGLNIGAFTALTVFYVEMVLGHPGRAGLLQLVLLGAGLVGVPVWIHVAGRLEKHTTLVICSLWSAAGGVAALLVPAGQLTLALLCYAGFGLAAGGSQFLPRAIMADLLDEQRLATGDEQAGLYFAFLTTTLKVGLALGVAVTFWLAGLAGFDPALARTDDSAHWVVRLQIGVFPIVLGLGTAALMWRFPLGRARQQALRGALAEVAAGGGSPRP